MPSSTRLLRAFAWCGRATLPPTTLATPSSAANDEGLPTGDANAHPTSSAGNGAVGSSVCAPNIAQHKLASSLDKTNEGTFASTARQHSKLADVQNREAASSACLLAVSCEAAVSTSSLRPLSNVLAVPTLLATTSSHQLPIGNMASGNGRCTMACCRTIDEDSAAPSAPATTDFPAGPLVASCCSTHDQPPCATTERAALAADAPDAPRPSNHAPATTDSTAPFLAAFSTGGGSMRRRCDAAAAAAADRALPLCSTCGRPVHAGPSSRQRTLRASLLPSPSALEPRHMSADHPQAASRRRLAALDPCGTSPSQFYMAACPSLGTYLSDDAHMQATAATAVCCCAANAKRDSPLPIVDFLAEVSSASQADVGMPSGCPATDTPALAAAATNAATRASSALPADSTSGHWAMLQQHAEERTSAHWSSAPPGAGQPARALPWSAVRARGSNSGMLRRQCSNEAAAMVAAPATAAAEGLVPRLGPPGDHGCSAQHSRTAHAGLAGEGASQDRQQRTTNRGSAGATAATAAPLPASGCSGNGCSPWREAAAPRGALATTAAAAADGQAARPCAGGAEGASSGCAALTSESLQQLQCQLACGRVQPKRPEEIDALRLAFTLCWVQRDAQEALPPPAEACIMPPLESPPCQHGGAGDGAECAAGRGPCSGAVRTLPYLARQRSLHAAPPQVALTPMAVLDIDFAI